VKIGADDCYIFDIGYKTSMTMANEEPAMRNLIIDGAAGGETKRRHDYHLGDFLYVISPLIYSNNFMNDLKTHLNLYY
jgi:hypothetical protein